MAKGLTWKDLSRVEFHFGEMKYVVDRKTRQARPVWLGADNQVSISGHIVRLCEERVKDLFDRAGHV